MEEKTFDLKWEGRNLKVTFGKIAWQTNSSCLVQYGETQVLATAVMSNYEREGMDYFPLLVDYEEKMYATGKIKGSRFIKRETRPSDEAVLTGRLIDRTIRPLFDQDTRRDVQVVITVLSLDHENAPDVISLLGATLTLNTSDIPWAGPVIGVRIVKKEGKMIVNPTQEERVATDFEMLVAGQGDKTIMIECEAREASESDLFEAVKIAQKSIAPVIDFINMIRKEIGIEKQDFSAEKTDDILEKEKEAEALGQELKKIIDSRLDDLLFSDKSQTKADRKNALGELAKELKQYFVEKETNETVIGLVMKKFDHYVDAYINQKILKEKKRVDDRKIDQVRPLLAETGFLLRTHGSSLFSRGYTQVMSVVTLGAPGDEQTLDGMELEGKKRFMHHYNFPGFSVGEVKPFRGASRRDIGHGALAEKALAPVLPDQEKFPYTIRVVSETMGSNGSSSMASTCASSLALMDAGVPIKKAVAGVAMGMASDEKGNFQIITDIQDMEDSDGGMDFKVAGTSDGVTAIQLDTKTNGLTFDMVEEALKMAKQGRLDILEVMNKEISQAREDLSPYAPRIEILKIDPDKIRDVIGPGGKVINEIIDKTGVAIDIEQDGTVFISSRDKEGMVKAIEWVKNITKEIEVGEIYDAKVVRIMDFGAFCELLPGQDGLLHVSEISYERTGKVTDVLNIGDIVKVKVIAVDDSGKVSLSKKALLEKPPFADRGSRGKDSRPTQRTNNFKR